MKKLLISLLAIGLIILISGLIWGDSITNVIKSNPGIISIVNSDVEIHSHDIFSGISGTVTQTYKDKKVIEFRFVSNPYQILYASDGDRMRIGLEEQYGIEFEVVHNYSDFETYIADAEKDGTYFIYEVTNIDHNALIAEPEISIYFRILYRSIPI